MTSPESDAPTTESELRSPWVKLRSASYQTFIYRRMVKAASHGAKPGDLVTVYDRSNQPFGHGLYNPHSNITLRMVSHAIQPLADLFWEEAITRAVTLRTKTLRLNDFSDAYRVGHSEGDDLSGLVVDRYGDVLSVAIYSLGMWRRIKEWLPVFHRMLGTKHHTVSVDENVMRLERFSATPITSPDAPSLVTITEHGVRFRVQFDQRHKTGFFCDQRENRKRLAALAHEAEVLDMCCHSGGFGLYAKTLGGADKVTSVDLDEHAVELARQNANLNQVRVETVHADAFSYMRQMHTNSRSYDVVVLDPPKFIFGKNDEGDGRTKYMDLNRLAGSLVNSGGLLLTCSCSGALHRDEFVKLVIGAVRRADRQAQVLDVTGPGPDHPVSPRCPESEYLKAVWLRLF